VSDADPVREETAALAAELARVGPPPPRVPPPPAAADPTTDIPRPDAEAPNRPETPPAEEPAPSAVEHADTVESPSRTAPRRRAATPRPTGSHSEAAETPSPGTSSPVNITITLTLGAAELLERARGGGVDDGAVPRATLREVVLNAVRNNTDELRRRHPTNVDPSGAIPRVRVKKRRRLEGYGKKVPVRLYRVEKEALDVLADELDVSVSAMVTEALELSYGADAHRQK
jgi:hypothetical protein